jgi:hypothetical protein
VNIFYCCCNITLKINLYIFVITVNPKWEVPTPSLRIEVGRKSVADAVFRRKRGVPAKHSSRVHRKAFSDYNYVQKTRSGSIMSGGVDLRDLLPVPEVKFTNRITEVYFYEKEIVTKHYVPGRDIRVKVHQWPEKWPLVIYHD